jgi:hypothetical protein
MPYERPCSHTVEPLATPIPSTRVRWRMKVSRWSRSSGNLGTRTLASRAFTCRASTAAGSSAPSDGHRRQSPPAPASGSGDRQHRRTVRLGSRRADSTPYPSWRISGPRLSLRSRPASATLRVRRRRLPGGSGRSESWPSSRPAVRRREAGAWGLDGGDGVVGGDVGHRVDSLGREPWPVLLANEERSCGLRPGSPCGRGTFCRLTVGPCVVRPGRVRPA